MFLKMLLAFILYIPFYLSSFEIQNGNSISDFLHTSKIGYKEALDNSQNSKIIHFVMGNESADLDSIVSSIGYAYLLCQKNTSDLYIPLMNIHREEIALRKDILYLFQLVGISIEDLLFLDDNVPLNKLFEEKRLRLNLVDHNVLKPDQEHLSDAIERIVDHHVDENIYYPLITDNNKLISVVGSNTTLIAEKIFSSQLTVSTDLATLLLAPILIDNSNFTSHEKMTSRDIEAAKILQNLISTLPEGFYQKLISSKNDISGLTPSMLLNKDFKEYLDSDFLYGISSLPETVQWDLKDLELIGEDIQKFALERNLAFLILLMPRHDHHIKQKILVYSPSADLLKEFDAYVQTDKQLSNILIFDSFSENFQALFYHTEKHIARKQLQPLFHFKRFSHK